MKRLVQFLAAALFGVGGLFVAATAASAHANIVTSGTVCTNVENGGEIVTWYIANDWNLREVATVVSPDPTAYPINPASVDIAASPSTSDEQVGTVSELFPDNPVGTFSLTVDGVWSDGYTQTATGYVTLTGACPMTPPTTIATPPTTIVPTPVTTIPAGNTAPTVPAPVTTTPAPAVTPTTIAPAPATVVPETSLTPVHYRPAKKAQKVVRKAIPQATSVHTGEPFAGTLWLVEVVAGFGALLMAAGIVINRRRAL